MDKSSRRWRRPVIPCTLAGIVAGWLSPHPISPVYYFIGGGIVGGVLGFLIGLAWDWTQRPTSPGTLSSPPPPVAPREKVSAK